MSKKFQKEEEFLENYRIEEFERPSVATDIVVFTVRSKKEDNYRKLPVKNLSILLIRRGEFPYKDNWALPGGFLKKEETLEMAAYRELREETNVDNIHLEQLHVFSEPKRDPRGWIISCSFIALTENDNIELKSQNDAKEAFWFDVKYEQTCEQINDTAYGYQINRNYKLLLDNEIENISCELEMLINVSAYRKEISFRVIKSDKLAFDHAGIIARAIIQLREKIENSNIAFVFVPERFTLTELQKIHEVILDRELLKANFRRKISDFVIETDEIVSKAGHRPSKLYIRNIDFLMDKNKIL